MMNSILTVAWSIVLSLVANILFIHKVKQGPRGKRGVQGLTGPKGDKGDPGAATWMKGYNDPVGDPAQVGYYEGDPLDLDTLDDTINKEKER